MRTPRILKGTIARLSMQGGEEHPNILLVRIGNLYFDLKTKATSVEEVQEGLKPGSRVKVEYIDPAHWTLREALPPLVK